MVLICESPIRVELPSNSLEPFPLGIEGSQFLCGLIVDLSPVRTTAVRLEDFLGPPEISGVARLRIVCASKHMNVDQGALLVVERTQVDIVTSNEAVLDRQIHRQVFLFDEVQNLFETLTPLGKRDRVFHLGDLNQAWGRKDPVTLVDPFPLLSQD